MENENSSNNSYWSWVVLFIGASIAIACFFDDHPFWCFFVTLITIIISTAMGQSEQAERDRKKRKIIRDEKAAQAQIEIDHKTPIYNQSRNELISKYGEPDKTIILEDLNINKEIIAFGKVNRIWILGNDLPMCDVLSCTFNDNQEVIKGKVTYETKTKSGNMVKRAVVGDVLFGGAGAVIGGSTAKKTTTAIQENDKIQHDYTVIINVNSLSNPVIRIYLGQKGHKVNEIVGLMNVIIGRNKK